MCVTPDDIEKLKEISTRIELRKEIIAEMEEEKLAEEKELEIQELKTNLDNIRNIHGLSLILLFVFICGLMIFHMSQSEKISKLEEKVAKNNNDSYEQRYEINKKIFNNSIRSKTNQSDIERLKKNFLMKEKK